MIPVYVFITKNTHKKGDSSGLFSTGFPTPDTNGGIVNYSRDITAIVTRIEEKNVITAAILRIVCFHYNILFVISKTLSE